MKNLAPGFADMSNIRSPISAMQNSCLIFFLALDFLACSIFFRAFELFSRLIFFLDFFPDFLWKAASYYFGLSEHCALISL